ncbi:ribosomal protein L11 methyltransferase [Polynucleobacter sp. SHI8]|uniref:50S ribosomal protein L11 methyltransferase n=1 Tax=unclassified Polynucleobacter TaxID=2640945 RepID=UPI00249041D6|nr:MULTISPECIES: 50S ribosomal protein L11 methyltransferase [unclassified Polynucleobacter]BDW10141.1 ribosomal protein L11 methyltransferase [Polynucleobacter sp. SHI2]BDW12587.1 ribosomal protein L11 methyltransferase [Polynucleobacter sp. SHI8]
MSFRQLQFTVDAQTAEELGDALMDLGALSISVEDAQANTPDESPLYGEPGMIPTQEAWNESVVQALFDNLLWQQFPQHTEAILAELAQSGLAVDVYTETIIEDQNWVQLTQSQFEPISITPNLWVVPSWHSIPEGLPKGAICLAVDPGLAFGTGSHPTTKLCLQWLEKLSHDQILQGKRVLDYGCGSGILAIAAQKLGSDKTIGIDIDPQAMVAGAQNAQNNHVDVSFYLPDHALDLPKFDVVVANILANPLQVLAPAIASHLAPHSALALSGILERQAQDVIACYAPWIELKVIDTHEGWVLLAGQR